MADMPYYFAIFWYMFVYNLNKAVQAVVVRIIVDGALIHYVLLHSMADLKTTQINIQCSLI